MRISAWSSDVCSSDLHVDLLGFLDQRAYPIDLGAPLQLAGDAVDHVAQAVERDRAGVDRPAPRRLLGQPGDVEIAIGRHQQRARDRRRRHHQGVDSLALAAEAHTLVPADAMLLVVTRQRERAEERRVGKGWDGPGKYGWVPA